MKGEKKDFLKTLGEKSIGRPKKIRIEKKIWDIPLLTPISVIIHSLSLSTHP